MLHTPKSEELNETLYETQKSNMHHMMQQLSNVPSWLQIRRTGTQLCFSSSPEQAALLWWEPWSLPPVRDQIPGIVQAVLDPFLLYGNEKSVTSVVESSNKISLDSNPETPYLSKSIYIYAVKVYVLFNVYTICFELCVIAYVWIRTWRLILTLKQIEIEGKWGKRRVNGDKQRK